MKKALILGATGLVGNQLLSLLAESNFYSAIYVPARNASRLAHVSGIQLIETDFEDIDKADWLKVDDVFCCLGTTIKKAKTQDAFRKVDYELPLKLAKLTKERGAKRYFLVSSVGADANSSIFYTRVKGELERELIALHFDQVHIARPAGLVGNRSEFRPGEFFGIGLSRLLSPFMMGRFKAYRPIHARTVAKAITFMAMRSTGDTVNIYESAQLQQLGKFG